MIMVLQPSKVCGGRSALSLPAALLCMLCVQAPLSARHPAGDATNLALHKPASSSSTENDEHSAEKANDGDSQTCWRADDEPEGGPEWWQVDLEKPHDLSGCRIRWPYAGKRYRYKVEGSADRKDWSLLSDQSKTNSVAQVHDLDFAVARQVRYVRITITGLDEGCWVSIAEVKIFGR